MADLSDHYSYHRPIAADEVYRPERPAWFAQAECKNHLEINWFPARGDKTGPAKMICAACPVRAACLEYGMQEHWGIYGGVTEGQRRIMRRNRNRLKKEAG